MTPDVLDIAGKVVVLSSPADVDATPEQLQGLVDGLRDAGAQLVILCPAGASLAAFDEDEMASAGWVSVQRGGSVEAWLKARRAATAGDAAWAVLDDLVDDLRQHADYGLPLAAPLPSM